MVLAGRCGASQLRFERLLGVRRSPGIKGLGPMALMLSFGSGAVEGWGSPS